MSWLRRLLLELWAMCVMAALVGFLGPFGTYHDGDLVTRIGEWWRLLMGAYLIVRPTVLLLERIATAASLPPSPLVFWGVAVASAPLAMLWGAIGKDTFRELGGLAGLVPFSLLCALAVPGVVWWAQSADARLGRHQVLADRPDADVLPAESVVATGGDGPESDVPAANTAAAACPLLDRLSPGFAGPIIALQSEDHYVRVYSAQGSELLLMRLRDAIAGMGDVPGEQVHRSWWIARAGIDAFELSGRACTIRLHNGIVAPVARESAQRLRQSGFLPAGATE